MVDCFAEAGWLQIICSHGCISLMIDSAKDYNVTQ